MRRKTVGPAAGLPPTAAGQPPLPEQPGRNAPPGRSDRSAWPMVGWLLVFVVIAAAAAGIATTFVSPSLALDMMSLWPGAAFGVIVWLAVWPLARRRKRLGAIGPLFVFSWLVLAVALHYSSWPPLPSSSAGLTIEVGGASAVELALTVDGPLELAAATDGMLAVTPLPGGASVGVPAVTSSVLEGDLRVLISEQDAGGWYRFGGWRLHLPAGPRLTLSLSAAGLAGDFASLPLERLILAGSGKVALAPTEGPVPISMSGVYRLIVPPSVPAEVIGVASVPAGWVATSTGYRSPAGGDGYRIEVADGATLIVLGP